MFISQLFESKLNENAEDLNIGDPVIIIGNVQFKGKTGEIVDFGKDKRFVVVDLYNHGRQSFHSSDVEFNDYADSEEEANDWQERSLGEEATGGYYAEDLAQQVFKVAPGLNASGIAEEVLDYGFDLAVHDLGLKRARYMFAYDEDFASDFVSAYAQLQRGVAEEYDPSYDPEYRGHQRPEQDPDAWKQERDLEQPSSPKTVTISDAEGNVVLQFPSTGGYYGDVRTAKEKGFDTEAGDYDIKWQKR